MYYLKLYYKLLEWEWHDNPNILSVFIHCLLKANRIDNKWRGINVKAGSFITSYENLSKITGLTVQQVRTAINKLKSTGELTYQSTSQYSIITINNWNDYQADNKRFNKRITNEQQTNNKQITTIRECKNDNNDKNEKNIYVIPNKNEILEYAKNQLGKNIDVDSFIAYYNASNWKDDNGFYINWKRKIIVWANNYKPPETDPTDRSHIFKELEEEARKAGKI